MNFLKGFFIIITYSLIINSSYSQDNYKQYLKHSYQELDSLTEIALHTNKDFSSCILYTQAAREKARFEFNEEDSTFVLHTANLAYFFSMTAEYDKALRLYTQAKDIREKTLGSNHHAYAQMLQALADVYRILGNYSKALSLYEQAKNIHKETFGEYSKFYGSSINNIATVYYSMGNYSSALALYFQSKRITAKVFGEDHYNFAVVLSNLASIHKKMGNYSKALECYTQSKAIMEKTIGKNHRSFSSILNNIANLHLTMDNNQAALSFLLEAKDIDERLLGTKHPSSIETLRSFARLYLEWEKYSQSLNYLQQIIKNSSTLSIPLTFDQTWSDQLKDAPYPSNKHLEIMLNALPLVYNLLEKDSSITDPVTKQLVVADLANALFTKARNQVSNEADKLRLLAKSSTWLQKTLEILPPEQNAHKAFQLSDQNKSVLLLQATKSEANYRLGGLPDSLILQDKKLLKKQSELQAKLLEILPYEESNLLRNQLNNINEDIDAFEKMIAKYFPQYYQLKYKITDTQVEDIQALLDQKTAFLEYVIGDSVVHIFYIDKNQIQWSKSFVSNKRLNQQIKSLHQSLSNYDLITKDSTKAYQAYIKYAHWFYQKLVAPVLKNKKHIQNLVLVTDGELGHLPFETFLTEEADQSITDYSKLPYLVKRYSISYNYSASLWKENTEALALKNNQQIFGIAPNYNILLDSSLQYIRSPTDQFARQILTPLPEARKEVEMLQQKYQGFFAFDSLASEKTVKEKAADFAILHFATHGIFKKKSPLLSSLVFSEDNDSLESNFWQAHEISKTQLNANLVVLSACETAYGKFEKGNGIASLARSFMYAGASALIVSLWQVNDFATSEIMVNLYDNLANGMKKDEALRQAKLDYIKSSKNNLAHPAFWSPFIMMGKTDVLSIQRKSNPFSWLIWGGITLALCSLGFMIARYRRKA